jgi:hypothetical protein
MSTDHIIRAISHDSAKPLSPTPEVAARQASLSFETILHDLGFSPTSSWQQHLPLAERDRLIFRFKVSAAQRLQRGHSQSLTWQMPTLLSTILWVKIHVSAGTLKIHDGCPRQCLLDPVTNLSGHVTTDSKWAQFRQDRWVSRKVD